MAIDNSNSTTTRLLTLLNVSATKAGKRKRAYYEETKPTEKLNKKRAVQFSLEQEIGAFSSEQGCSNDAGTSPHDATEEAEEEIVEDDEELGEHDRLCASLSTELKLFLQRRLQSRTRRTLDSRRKHSRRTHAKLWTGGIGRANEGNAAN